MLSSFDANVAASAKYLLEFEGEVAFSDTLFWYGPGTVNAKSSRTLSRRIDASASIKVMMKKVKRKHIQDIIFQDPRRASSSCCVVVPPAAERES